MTAYLLDISNDCHKFMATLPPKQFRQVGKALFELVKDPYPNDSSILEGQSGCRRKDVGEYRVVYRVDEGIVRIVIIGKRNDSSVYKILKQL